jgi:hypothetical protein
MVPERAGRAVMMIPVANLRWLGQHRRELETFLE